jgi:uncharacterized protein involved in type VI secretion and phage assembly
MSVASKYFIEIGKVTKVMPHESSDDGVNYHCDIVLRDNNQSLSNVSVISPRMGFACIPEKDDLVLVGFISGSLHMPVILGTLYNDKVKPPIYHEGESVLVCPKYKNDKPKKEEVRRIYMELPGSDNGPGMKLTVREDDIHYELEKYKFDLKRKDGIKLEVNEKTSLAISKEGDITITAKDTKISINKEGEISIDSKQKVGIKTTADVSLESSGGNMKLSANKITLDGKQAVEIKGTNTTVEAQAQLELKGATAKLESQAMLEVKGAIANIQASGVMNLKGSLVNIN